MNTANLKAKLNAEKGKLKQKLASLTNDDLLLEEGRREEREGKYQALLFQTEEELDRILVIVILNSNLPFQFHEHLLVDIKNSPDSF